MVNPTVLTGVSTPSISICSPLAKVPEVWVKDIIVELPPAPTAYPLAPLFFPLMYDPSLISVSELSVFNPTLV